MDKPLVHGIVYPIVVGIDDWFYRLPTLIKNSLIPVIPDNVLWASLEDVLAIDGKGTYLSQGV